MSNAFRVSAFDQQVHKRVYSCRITVSPAMCPDVSAGVSELTGYGFQSVPNFVGSGLIPRDAWPPPYHPFRAAAAGGRRKGFLSCFPASGLLPFSNETTLPTSPEFPDLDYSDLSWLTAISTSRPRYRAGTAPSLAPTAIHRGTARPARARPSILYGDVVVPVFHGNRETAKKFRRRRDRLWRALVHEKEMEQTAVAKAWTSTRPRVNRVVNGKKPR